ncbi:MAG: hypothetical protein QXG00_01790 [Candidatus Woesearchaeota archaeon]
MLKVKCPKCHQEMLYNPNTTNSNLSEITKKIKKCVYCGHSFKVHSELMKSRLVKIGK